MAEMDDGHGHAEVKMDGKMEGEDDGHGHGGGHGDEPHDITHHTIRFGRITCRRGCCRFW